MIYSLHTVFKNHSFKNEKCGTVGSHKTRVRHSFVMQKSSFWSFCLKEGTKQPLSLAFS